MRIAATADLHYTAQRYPQFHDQMGRARDEADVLVIAGDMTNYGQVVEMEALLNELVRVRIPTIAVLGNHDYENGVQVELMKMMTDAGIKVLDGTAYERDGVGFAGAKGFPGGFGRGMLTAFGEPEIKSFVQTGIDESLKLERAMSQLRTEKRVVVIHYAPIGDTVEGEPPEIFPYLGSSRLAEVIDRHGASLVVHGHAHHGKPNGKTTAGVPVHNVAVHVLQTETPNALYRVFEV
ncbi:MAG TPA: metallophosphoesterase [Terriglobales bacterium]|jgi:Icc-related predicted phosphoesterase|nr:metallophosphoesterase [Terriglobales bacterium]